MKDNDRDDLWDDLTPPMMWTPRARVLVVDDDAEMRGLVSDRLVSSGYLVREAASGFDLLNLVHSFEEQHSALDMDAVDIVLLDHLMPGITGLEAIRRLRLEHWNTPAILMTAFPEEDVKREAEELRVSVLPKPFTFNLLSSAILVSLLHQLF